MNCIFDTIEIEFQGNVSEAVHLDYVKEDSEDVAQTQKVLNSLIIDSISELPTLLSQRSVNKDVWFKFSWKSVLKRMRRDIIIDMCRNVTERIITEYFVFFCVRHILRRNK